MLVPQLQGSIPLRPSTQPVSNYQPGQLDLQDLSHLNQALEKLDPSQTELVVYLDIDDTLLLYKQSEQQKTTALNDELVNQLIQLKKRFPNIVFRLITARSLPENMPDAKEIHWNEEVTSVGAVIKKLEEITESKEDKNLKISIEAENVFFTSIMAIDPQNPKQPKMISRGHKIDFIKAHHATHIQKSISNKQKKRLYLYFEDSATELKKARQASNDDSFSLIAIKIYKEVTLHLEKSKAGSEREQKESKNKNSMSTNNSTFLPNSRSSQKRKRAEDEDTNKIKIPRNTY